MVFDDKNSEVISMKRYIKSSEIGYFDDFGEIEEYVGHDYRVVYDEQEDIYDVRLIETDEIVNSFNNLDDAIDWVDMMEN